MSVNIAFYFIPIGFAVALHVAKNPVTSTFYCVILELVVSWDGIQVGYKNVDRSWTNTRRRGCPQLCSSEEEEQEGRQEEEEVRCARPLLPAAARARALNRVGGSLRQYCVSNIYLFILQRNYWIHRMIQWHKPDRLRASKSIGDKLRSTFLLPRSYVNSQSGDVEPPSRTHGAGPRSGSRVMARCAPDRHSHLMVLSAEAKLMDGAGGCDVYMFNKAIARYLKVNVAWRGDVLMDISIVIHLSTYSRPPIRWEYGLFLTFWQLKVVDSLPPWTHIWYWFNTYIRRGRECLICMLIN